MANLKVELVKSLNGRHEKHIATANSMGLRKIGDTSVQPDNDQTRGKIAKIDRKSTRLNSSHTRPSRMPSSA